LNFFWVHVCQETDNLTCTPSSNLRIYEYCSLISVLDRYKVSRMHTRSILASSLVATSVLAFQDTSPFFAFSNGFNFPKYDANLITTLPPSLTRSQSTRKPTSCYLRTDTERHTHLPRHHRHRCLHTRFTARRLRRRLQRLRWCSAFTETAKQR